MESFSALVGTIRAAVQTNEWTQCLEKESASAEWWSHRSSANKEVNKYRRKCVKFIHVLIQMPWPDFPAFNQRKPYIWKRCVHCSAEVTEGIQKETAVGGVRPWWRRDGIMKEKTEWKEKSEWISAISRACESFPRALAATDEGEKRHNKAVQWLHPTTVVSLSRYFLRHLHWRMQAKPKKDDAAAAHGLIIWYNMRGSLDCSGSAFSW